MAKIPTVDLSRDGSKAVDILGRALEDIGFVFLRSPENRQVMGPAYEQFRRVFTLPTAVKEQYAHPEIFYQRGWTPNFKELGLACRRMGPKKEDHPDAKECWGMGPDLMAGNRTKELCPNFYPANVWPKEVPEFQPAMNTLYCNLYFTGLNAFGLLEKYMGLKPDYFRTLTHDAPHFMRAIHYPPVTAEEAAKVQWGCKHTDINFLTVLPVSTRSGLWVRCHDGSWVPGRPDEDCVIVQVGDMLQHHTAGRFRSAVHEVRAPKEGTNEGRLSAALFIHARPDTVLNPEPKGGRFPSITAGDYLIKRLAAIGLASTRY